ncbi:prephenate dehydrogenase [Streptomyces sp. NPDC001292]|uniref:prephenate dehydrogenase n=1 Tax=Streptomyces sp. NPDC001292 TaxID=3364558 RepID=UPI0036C6FEDF
MAVIGTGLIGTSIGLAASRQGTTVFLSDRDPVAARTAAALGAGRAEDPDRPVDLAVLAVPPSQVGGVLAELQARGFADCYTDVASVKAGPERAALRQAPEPARYIGGHPLAGRERSGPLAARADLFQARPWVLTPSSQTSAAALRRARELVLLCGAVPVMARSRAHDDAVALTSHVPHLVASLMAARLREGPDRLSRFAGQGLRDVTRIARGDSRLWGDILQSNAASIIGVVRDLHADLGRLLAALDALAEPEDGDGPADGDERAVGMRTMVDLLDRGIAGLDRLPAPGAGGTAEDSRVRVAVADRPGELSRLLDALAGFGVAADDVTVEDTSQGAVVGPAAVRRLTRGGLTVRFAVAPPVADRVVAELVAGGWAAGGEERRSARRYGEARALPVVRT